MKREIQPDKNVVAQGTGQAAYIGKINGSVGGQPKRLPSYSPISGGARNGAVGGLQKAAIDRLKRKGK